MNVYCRICFNLYLNVTNVLLKMQSALYNIINQTTLNLSASLIKLKIKGINTLEKS